MLSVPTGDHTHLGDHEETKPVFYPDSVHLLQLAAEMMGRFIRKHKSKFQGVHIIPLGWADIVPDILQEAEIAAETE